MKGYRDYMDRQQVSPALHDKLLALEQQRAPRKAQPLKYWKPVLAMAACLCLVLGVSWGRSLFSSSADSAASTAEYAMDASAQEAGDEAVPESAVALEGSGSFAIDSAASAADEADEPETEESAPAEESSEEDSSEDAVAEAALTPPEDALLPGWLPEGYSLTAVEAREEAHCYRLTWSDGTDEITLEYAYDTQPPEELDWPVYDRAAADWETVSQGEAQGDTWGFCLYDEALSCWQCFTTTGDHETLWNVAQSMVR